MKIPISSWTKFREVILFIIVGILNTIVDFVVLNLLILLTHHDHGWWLLPFDGLSFLAAVINSYVLNTRFTFRSSESGGSWRFLRFVVVNAVGLIVNTLTVWTLSPLLGVVLSPIVAVNASKVLATIFSLGWNYFAMKRWIFRGKKTVVQNDDDESDFVPVHAVMESETKSAV